VTTPPHTKGNFSMVTTPENKQIVELKIGVKYTHPINYDAFHLFNQALADIRNQIERRSLFGAVQIDFEIIYKEKEG
jgi:hypothetical protein